MTLTLTTLDRHTDLLSNDPNLGVHFSDTLLAPYRTYHHLRLDKFQQAACALIDRGLSLIVAAPTGSGKTVVADFLLEKAYGEGKQVFYTAPIKALSMQKYREFKRLLGDQVGILTGDIVINSEAPVVIMTTEVLHNMLMEDDLRRNLDYVIFDEIHYLGDRDRGHVWEQCLILLPQYVKILGLSATIPNLQEFVSWLGEVRESAMAAIRHSHRPVPLTHYAFEKRIGKVLLSDFPKKLQEAIQQTEYFFAEDPDQPIIPRTRVLDLVSELDKKDLPALVFVFSRKQCENLALEAAQIQDYLNPREKARIEHTLSEVRRTVKGSESLKNLAITLPRGIAFHHAGLLPALKSLVEELFEEGLVKLNFATETWALGINMPVRTTCFASPSKYDGEGFRKLKEHEYFQMAGRAGRRGIDKSGKSIIVFDACFHSINDLPSADESRLEPLRSSFNLTYNTVLNLAARYTDQEVLELFAKSFGAFHDRERAGFLRNEIESVRGQIKELVAKLGPNPQGKKGKDFRRFKRLSRREKRMRKELQELDVPESRFRTYALKRRLLEDNGYIREGELLYRGQILQYLHVQELLVAELVADGIMESLSVAQLAALAVSIDYEPRRGERTPSPFFSDKRVYEVVTRVMGWEEHYLGKVETLYHESMAIAADAWVKGAAFATILRMTGADEGSIVTQFRRAIDLLRQVRQAARGIPSLQEKAQEALTLLDRDVVSVYL